MAKLDIDSVWVFSGPQPSFPSGVFTEKEIAEQWIGRHRLAGTLTRYPLDVGVYDWALSKGLFTPRKEDQSAASFIARFSSASQEHYHFENGRRETGW